MSFFNDLIFDARAKLELRNANNVASRIIERHTGYDVSGWRHIDGAMVEWLSRSERWSPSGLSPENAAAIRFVALLDCAPKEMLPSLKEGFKRLIVNEEIHPQILDLISSRGLPR